MQHRFIMECLYEFILVILFILVYTLCNILYFQQCVIYRTVVAIQVLKIDLKSLLLNKAKFAADFYNKS